MTSGLARLPVATRGNTAENAPPAAEAGRGRAGTGRADRSGTAQGGARRAGQAGARRAADPPAVIVAGTPRVGKSAVVAALLASDPAAGAPAVPVAPAGAQVTPVAPVAPAVAGWPVRFVVYRHHADVGCSAYLPGHRDARAVEVEALSAQVGPGAVPPDGMPRAPRRIEITHPARLLTSATIVDTPGLVGVDSVYAEIVLDAAARGALLFVVDATRPLGAAQLELLAEVDKRGIATTFVLTKVDAFPAWPAVLAANQALVHSHAPGLAAARWFAVNALGGPVPTPAAWAGPVPAIRPAPEEAARGLAGLDVADLARSLLDGTVTGTDGRSRVPVQPSPVTVAPGATDDHWRQLLDRNIHARRAASLQRLAIDLAGILERGAAEVERGCAGLPELLDWELHRVSVRTTRLLDAAAQAVIRRVFGAILDVAPDERALAAIRGATRRALEQAGGAGVGDAGRWDRMLLLTATSGVAVVAGPGAMASQAAATVDDPAQRLLPPVAVALTAGCYLLWCRPLDGAGRRPPDPDECRRWLRRAVRAVEVELERELSRRYADLHSALALVAEDAVDHGVLLV